MSDHQYDITRAEFEAGRDIRFGKSNPDRMQDPFWEKMISTQADPYLLEVQFGIEASIALADVAASTRLPPDAPSGG